MLLQTHRTAASVAVDHFHALLAEDEAAAGLAAASLDPGQEKEWGMLIASLQPQAVDVALGAIPEKAKQARLRAIVEETQATAARLQSHGHGDDVGPDGQPSPAAADADADAGMDSDPHGDGPVAAFDPASWTKGTARLLHQ